jgi:hypothetical protein
MAREADILPTKKVQIQVRFDEELLDKLKEIASAEHRTMNNLIEHYIKTGVEKYEKTKDLL